MNSCTTYAGECSEPDQQSQAASASTRMAAMNARQGNEQQVSVLGERILEVLRGALTAEAVAQGAARRRAYRVTRHLLGGAVQSGLSRGYIAQQLGLNVSS